MSSKWDKTAQNLSKGRLGKLSSGGSTAVLPVNHDPDVDPLIKEINTRVDGIKAALSRSIALGIEIGQLLTEKRNQLKRGDWGAWLAKARTEHGLKFGERQAQKYMTLYSNQQLVLSAINNSQAPAEIGINDALDIIRGNYEQEVREERVINPRHSISQIRELIRRLKTDSKPKFSKEERNSVTKYLEEQATKIAAKQAEISQALEKLKS